MSWDRGRRLPDVLPATSLDTDYPKSDTLLGMPSRGRSNPLALAVLGCLQERPMHPYEVAQTLRMRAKHLSIRLNYGSLYSVVEGLERRGLIEAKETVREGKRPERTVYGITEAGRTELDDWLAELIAVPEKEYLQFEAALSMIAHLAPAQALDLLDQRAHALEEHLAVWRSAPPAGLARLYLLEHEFQSAVLQTELDFVRRLRDDIESGGLDGIDEWRRFHGDAPASEAPPKGDPHP
jgi:DNA-binding PadR family transcriptional regulator